MLSISIKGILSAERRHYEVREETELRVMERGTHSYVELRGSSLKGTAYELGHHLQYQP